MPSISSQSTAINKDVDTYHKLRATNPIKYGEELARLCDEGRTQKEIAEELSCNRQMVGRYQRIGKWPDNVKDIICSNREIITNTKILNLASRALTDSELLSEVKAMIGNQLNEGEVKTFPTVNGFNELIGKLESIENRLIALEGLQVEDINPSNAPAIDNLATRKQLTWHDILNFSTTPASVALVICITFLTAYLVYQGIVFFSAIDTIPISAISSAVISELIPFLCAACFALATRNSHRLIAFTMLMVTIVGLGFFMHSSLSTQLTRGSGRYGRLVESRKLTIATIATHSSALDNLPVTYITKRQSLSEKIGLERENLDRIDREIDSLESYGGGFQNTGLGYAVWIRIAAMLLNAYLIHFLFSGLRRKNEMPA